MNAELISLILTILSNIQVPAGRPAAHNVEAVYASWESSASIVYRCYDPSSPISPMGQPLIVASGFSKCDASGCSSIAAAMPVMVYPKDMTCEKAYRIEHHKIFESMAEAGAFRLGLTDDAKWNARQATDDEVVKWALDRKQWRILHYPGGDMYSYPNGVFEVYPAAELSFTTPLGTGTSSLAAVADALKQHRGEQGDPS